MNILLKSQHAGTKIQNTDLNTRQHQYILSGGVKGESDIPNFTKTSNKISCRIISQPKRDRYNLHEKCILQTSLYFNLIKKKQNF